MLQPRRTIAVHPGEILQEILDQNQITQSEVAQRLHMAQSKISDICRGKRGVTPDMAMRLGRLFGQSPLFWLNLQKNWELSQLDESAYANIDPLLMPA
jgi:addiction module HigA family antidote